ncbi:hypothetical protein FWH30_01790 [Microgenomates group bacterium]|nr:hypothetical protein [Microgenomates group bacterium]
MSISSRLSRPSTPITRPQPLPPAATSAPKLTNRSTFQERMKLKKMFAARPSLDNPASAAARERFNKQTRDLSTSAYKVDPQRLKTGISGSTGFSTSSLSSKS